jgi:predicted RNase H-like nuclease (RuvC/YqgF family)
MVRKYEPGYKFYDYEEEPSLVMQESKYGKFVKLETFNHEIARLTAQVERQKKHIANLEEKLKEKKDKND